MRCSGIALILALRLAGMASAEVISISSLKAGATYHFTPDFSRLGYYTQKCEVDGWEPKTLMFLVTAGAEETYVNVNPGTTQYQGHYVWLTNKVVSGFGTYTSSKKSRSFGWIFRNDTGKELKIASMRTTYGQWGARNSRPDTLSFDCLVSDRCIDVTGSNDWRQVDVDAFTSPYTNNAPNAVFPYFEDRRLSVDPGRIPYGAYFAVRFTDTCPPAGNNAHLGISDMVIEFDPRHEGLKVLFK